MIEFGIRLARDMKTDTVIALIGDLGAGKTTLAKGLICGLTGTGVDDVSSPTFQYVSLYEGQGRSVAHFDLWRLAGVDEFVSLGFEDLLTTTTSLIEWPDRISILLPPETLFITSRVVEGGREVIIGDHHGAA